MKTYKLTAYEPQGKVIMDESLVAATDEDAIEKGQIILEGKNCSKQHIGWLRLPGNYFYSI